MSIQVTVTGKNGPGLSVTTAVIAGLSEVRINTDQMTLQMFKGGQALDAIDLTTATTLTGTIAGSTSTVTVVLS